MYTPFSMEGMTPEEEKTWDIKEERSLETW